MHKYAVKELILFRRKKKKKENILFKCWAEVKYMLGPTFQESKLF